MLLLAGEVTASEFMQTCLHALQAMQVVSNLGLYHMHKQVQTTYNLADSTT